MVSAIFRSQGTYIFEKELKENNTWVFFVYSRTQYGNGQADQQPSALQVTLKDISV